MILFTKLLKNCSIIKKLIDDGFTGRKGKGGFFRMNKSESGKKILESLDYKNYYIQKNQVKPNLQFT